MAIKRYVAIADTTITNAYKANFNISKGKTKEKNG